MKKNIYSILFCSLSLVSMAQVAIDKNSVNGASTLLDFNNISGNTNGIIVPTVDNKDNALATNTAANNGTFLFDKSDNQFKMYEDGRWRDISGVGDGAVIVTNASTEVAEEQGVIIGSDASEAKGALVLESSDKALQLPIIDRPDLNVKNPYPGMMCFDSYSASVALFDGKYWNYLDIKE